MAEFLFFIDDTVDDLGVRPVIPKKRDITILISKASCPAIVKKDNAAV